ncbi:MAG: hypothetical protein ACRDTA_18690 [Pseudonocardiaceae bacterium]
MLELEQLCHQVGAEFVELALLSNPQDAADRFVRRSRHPETSVHRDAQALVERSGGAGELPAMYERLLQVIASRPRTITVMTIQGQVGRTYHDFLAHIYRE